MSYCLDYLSKESINDLNTHVSVSHAMNKKLSYQVIEHGTILPEKSFHGKVLGGIVDPASNYVEESAFHEGLGGGYEYSDVTKDVRKERVIYIGVLYGMWGHLLTDGIKKLWFLNSRDGMAMLEKGYKVIYLTKGNKPLPSYCKDFYALAGFDLGKWECVSNVKEYDEIIVPDNSMLLTSNERMYTPEFVKSINDIKSAVLNLDSDSLDYSKKVYFTRTQLKTRREIGEQRIENAFIDAGFKIVAPEKCSIQQQIYYMLKCDCFATTEGSCAHNSIFCAEGTEVTILRKADYVNSYQIMINEMANLNVTYIDANRTVDSHPNSKWDGPFYLDVTKELKTYLGIHRHYLPYFLRADFLMYLMSVLMRRLKSTAMRFVKR